MKLFAGTDIKKTLSISAGFQLLIILSLTPSLTQKPLTPSLTQKPHTLRRPLLEVVREGD
jgi:hypothetical protein